jgi:hypothetical protein
MADMNVSELQKRLAASNALWKAAENPIARLAADERRRRLGFKPGPNEPSLKEREAISKTRRAAVRAMGAPASFDLRNVGGSNFVTSVKDQGGCGSCVAFGTIATVESALQFARKNPNLGVDLSEAHLFSCIGKDTNATCADGWWPEAALDGVRDVGVTDEACFPYRGEDQNCESKCSDWQSRLTKILGWHRLNDVAGMKEWIAERGPLVACFTVYEDFFAYSTGVYHHTVDVEAGGHCVSVVGFDDTEGCWICKNSWDSSWGDGGFFRIQYGDSGIDASMWGVDVTARTVPLYRYWNAGGGDHFYTTDWNELGGGNYGWGYEEVQCEVFATQAPGSVPLHRYWNPDNCDHFYTTDWNELGQGNYGWGYEGVQCYVYPGKNPDTIPLHRYWNPTNGDHFYTTDWHELGGGNYGWGYEGIQCYVYGQSASGLGVKGGGGASIPATFRRRQEGAKPVSFTTATSTRLGIERPSSSFTMTKSGGDDPRVEVDVQVRSRKG